jgi:hypothetical protein
MGTGDNPRQPRLAICLHVFYTDLIPFYLTYLEKLSGKADIFVTCRPEIARATRTYFTNRKIPFTLSIQQNEGYDIAPFLKLCTEHALESYTAVLKLHTKNQANKARQEQSRIILDHLCGSPQFLDQIGLHFNAGETVGMAGSTFQLRSADALMYGNRQKCSEIQGLLNTRVPNWNFFTATMFWLSGKLIKRLKSHTPALLDILRSDVSATRGSDGSYAHAMERIFGLLPDAWDMQKSLIERRSLADAGYSIADSRTHITGTDWRFLFADSLDAVNRYSTPYRAADTAALQNTALFDPIDYRRTAGCRISDDTDPLYHFCLYGDTLGLNPSPAFCTRYYLLKRPDVIRKQTISLLHFVKFGSIRKLVTSPAAKDWYDLLITYAPAITANADDKGLPPQATSMDHGTPEAPELTVGFLRDKFLDEQKLYDSMYRAAKSLDIDFLRRSLEIVRPEYGSTVAVVEASAVCQTLAANYQTAKTSWADLAGARSNNNTPLRHLKSFFPKSTFRAATPRDRVTQPALIDPPDDVCRDTCIYTTPSDAFAGIEDIAGIGKSIPVLLVPPSHDYQEYLSTPVETYDHSLFIADLVILTGRVKPLLQQCRTAGPLALFRHAFHGTIQEFAVHICLRNPAVAAEAMDIIMRYREMGIPDRVLIPDTRVIWQQNSNLRVRKLMRRCHEMQRGNYDLADLCLACLVWEENLSHVIFTDTSTFAYYSDIEKWIAPKASASRDVFRAEKYSGDITAIQLMSNESVADIETASLFARAGLKRPVVRSPWQHVKQSLAVISLASADLLLPDDLAKQRQHNLLIVETDTANISPILLNGIDYFLARNLNTYIDLRRRLGPDRVFHLTRPISDDVSRRLSVAADVFSTNFPKLTNDLKAAANTTNTGPIPQPLQPFGDLLRSEDAVPALIIDPTLVNRTSDASGFLCGFLAAHAGAVLLANRDLADRRYYLGPDYPFYAVPVDKPVDLIPVIGEVKLMFEKQRWVDAKAILHEVRERSTSAWAVRELHRILEIILRDA